MYQNTALTSCRLAVLAEVFKFFFLMPLFRAEQGSFQYILVILFLKVFERQNTVIFIDLNDVMCIEALFTPKHATLETIRTLGAILLTVSTSNLAGFAFFNGQHINQAVQIKTGGKIFQIATIRHFAKNLAFRASDCVLAMAWFVPKIQALQTEAVKTWKVLWICVNVSTHWTRNFFTKIVKQRFDIHDSSVSFEEGATTVA